MKDFFKPEDFANHDFGNGSFYDSVAITSSGEMNKDGE